MYDIGRHDVQLYRKVIRSEIFAYPTFEQGILRIVWTPGGCLTECWFRDDSNCERPSLSLIASTDPPALRHVRPDCVIITRYT